MFLVSEQNLSLGALKIIKNEVELRKLQPPKVEGVKNSRKQITKHFNDQVFEN